MRRVQPFLDRRVRVAVLLALVTAAPASAQTFVELGPMSVFEVAGNANDMSPSAPNKGLGGHVVGLTASVGWATKWGLFVEAAIPKHLTVDRNSSLFLTHDKFRDTVISGLLCFCQLKPLEVTIGLSQVRQHLVRQLVDRNAAASSCPIEIRSSTNLFAVTSGVGVPLKLSQSIEVVPKVRLHFIKRHRDDFSLAAAFVVVHSSVMLRVKL